MHPDSASQDKIVVKFSHPPKKYGYEDIGGRGQSPGNLGLWGDYRFEFNTDLDECDYWFVYESVPRRERVRVPLGNVVFMPSEPEIIRSYAPEYLRQFDWVATSRRDFPAERVIPTHFINGWWLRKTYDQLKSDDVAKPRTLSLLGSDVVTLAPHRQRFAFLNRMIGHFKDRVDVFGTIDGRYWSDKYAALAPYRYSFIIENGQLPDYWSEKLMDCYLSQTMPLYWGCPNLTEYFAPESFIPIDLDDWRSSIRTIEEAIEGGAYERHRDAVIQAKHRVLDEYQFFPYVVKIVTQHRDRFGPRAAKRPVELAPAQKRMGVNELGEERSFVS